MTAEIGLFEAMFTQRAIRRLKSDPVPEELIVKMLEAATKAPSGGNRQPWTFIMIQEAETKRKIGNWYLDAWNRSYGAVSPAERDAAPASVRRTLKAAEHLAHHLSEAPVLLLVCARNAPPPGGGNRSGHYGSIYPAVQNLLLAARGLGLGASLTTLHKVHEEDVKHLLDIPEDVETVALIPVGYPAGKYGPTSRRPVEKVLYRERWGGRLS